MYDVNRCNLKKLGPLPIPPQFVLLPFASKCPAFYVLRWSHRYAYLVTISYFWSSHLLFFFFLLVLVTICQTRASFSLATRRLASTKAPTLKDRVSELIPERLETVRVSISSLGIPTTSFVSRSNVFVLSMARRHLGPSSLISFMGALLTLLSEQGKS